MADEFSTPISKIQSISTRDDGGGKAEPVTYEDILRQQAQPEEDRQPQQQAPMTQMQAPMHQMQPPQMQQAPMHQMQAPMHQMQPMQAPMAQYQHSDYGDDHGDEYPRHTRHETHHDPPPPANTSPWLVRKLKRHKNDIIFALALFATLTVVIPRLRAMPRFQEGIPMIVVGMVSVLVGSLTNTITMAL